MSMSRKRKGGRRCHSAAPTYTSTRGSGPRRPGARSLRGLMCSEGRRSDRRRPLGPSRLTVSCHVHSHVVSYLAQGDRKGSLTLTACSDRGSHRGLWSYPLHRPPPIPACPVRVRVRVCTAGTSLRVHAGPCSGPGVCSPRPGAPGGREPICAPWCCCARAPVLIPRVRGQRLRGHPCSARCPGQSPVLTLSGRGLRAPREQSRPLYGDGG